MNKLVQEVWARSGGSVIMQRAEPNEFLQTWRGPAAYFTLSAKKRAALVPDSRSPIRWDR